MICEAWNIVTVPFPFTDRATPKRRPALVLSKRSFNRHGHSLMAMITSARPSWPGDSPLSDLAISGLSGPCIVRLKIFTLDNRLIVKRIGQLSGEDRNRVAAARKAVLPF